MNKIDELFALNTTNKDYSNPSAAQPIRKYVRMADHLCPKAVGITPLHQAAFHGSCKKIKKLIKQGTNINVTDNLGWTPLHDAVIQDHVKLVKLLIRAGADVNAQDTQDGYTPLHDALRMNYRTIAKMLLAAHADTSLKDNAGDTAFELFAK